MKTVGTPAARLAVVASLASWIALSFIPLPRPIPAPATAPAPDFSAARALEQVRAIAQKPHPVGSAEHDRVRDYIQSALAKQGLTPELEEGFSEFNRGRYHASANVQNIFARLPGTANTRPVMLVAHYDSATRGPGASDDGHGVAVLLETLRALRAGPPLRNDVIFLITDGEERGLLGAMLFMREHPWRNQPGVTFNFEARGTSGNATMFETSTDNEWLVRGLQAAVPQADATSVGYEIYRHMPNNTDLSVFKAGGLSGMNFAFIEHPEYYHTAQDTVEHLDPVSLQEQGRYALSLTRWFGDRDLSTHSSGDAVYFATAFTALIVYPVSWASTLAAIAAIGGIAGVWAGRRRRARGLWISVPLLLLGGLEFWVIGLAPGVTYLLAWPLLGSVAAFGLLMTAPPALGVGWRVGAMAVFAAPAILLVIPLLSSLIVALTLRGAAPVLAAAAVLVLICLLPQIVFVLRRPANAEPTQ
jgi:hypothetical protein